MTKTETLAYLLRQNLDAATDMCNVVQCAGVSCGECPFNNDTSFRELSDELDEIVS